ncbi:uncharacterized protein LOC142317732 [Lycorma delicatula]|uniref:uncharacterized protein LOC142317732 n=1 Tax=Lycorma delicatula TaxID=130591 RepID=UPI003F5176E5
MWSMTRLVNTASCKYASIHWAYSRQEAYNRRQTYTRPAGIRARELMEKYNIVLPRVVESTVCDSPLWLLPLAFFQTDLARFKHCNSQEITHPFQELLSEHNRELVFYTDGSETANGVGSTFYCAGVSHSWSLPAIASVYTAELYAIWQALRYCEHYNVPSFLICSDSLSSIQALQDAYSTDPLAKMILALLRVLSKKGQQSTLMWILGHPGIADNEAADEAARVAAEEPEPDGIPVRPSDVKCHVSACVRREWHRVWSGLTTKLNAVKDSPRKWTTPLSIKRREQVVITRLRIGHTNLTLTGGNQLVCEGCQQPLTVKHLLEDRIVHRRLRRQFEIEGGIKRILRNDECAIKDLLFFLYTAGLFNCIRI